LASCDAISFVEGVEELGFVIGIETLVLEEFDGPGGDIE
jgi:hypothetical protein